ncbi:aldo/keto reductase [Luteimonas sp. Y-2-2-4F]|nr:aldo/keto reductase [Luteimonas sp. Y-2-2-4F]MCD9033809.1 aldo/keto reductase [Luteimonas sp. Y-2-2-4F]
MNYRVIGRTGIQVSQLCFGTMSFGSYADEAASRAMFARCREAGINFFDCANSYAGSRAESILGACIDEAGCRDEIVLVTKVCRPMRDGVNGRGLSRHHIMREVEQSLRRLRTDRIDFYFMHHYDPLTPVEASLRAFDDLQRQGKILYPAVSNWAAWRIAKALGISERNAWARFELVQPMYNLVKRQAEVELFPLAQSEQLGAIVYSPLASGLLTGLYGVDRRPAQGRLNEARYQARYAGRAPYEVADAFTAFCRARGFAPPALAVAWAMSHPAVTAPIVGAETVEQLDGYLAAFDIPMDAALREEVGALSDAPDGGVERTVD